MNRIRPHHSFWTFLLIVALLAGFAANAGQLESASPQAPAIQESTDIQGVFLTFHLEVSRAPRIQTLWPLLVDFMELADQYGAKISLQFSAPWAEYVTSQGLTDTVLAWEANGHEIALHHHGPTHKFFDGYTERPDRIRTDGWYATDGVYKGDMAALMALLDPLTNASVVSAGMSDGETDWPEGVRYYATKYEEENSKADLISVPWQATYNGHTVTVVTNAGYAIDHLGDAAVTLAEIEQALQDATPDQVMGLVLNDDTVENHFDQIEPLFQLLARYGVQGGTIRDTLSSYQAPEATPTPVPTTPAGTPTPSPTPQPFTPVPDATYGAQDGVSYVRIPTTDCANLTATPILVGDWLVYPMHEHGQNCSENSAYQRTLFGYNTQDGQLYILRQDGAGEAPLLYDPQLETLYWTTTFGGTVFILEPETFQLRQKVNVGTTSDSGGVVLDGLYYFGTVNTPNPICQDPINENCGAVFALDSQGNVVHTLNTDDGFRAWVGTSITTDGEYLYVGSAKQTKGGESQEESGYLYGCSVTKMDKELNILASFDPGDIACHKLPFVGANADSVSGEIVPDGSGLWVQYVRPNQADDSSGALEVALYRLNLDLEEQCRVEFPFEPQTQAVGFYQGPTVDQEGNAYIGVTVPDATHTRTGQLYKVTPSCQTTLLAEVPGSWAQASPTLADDQFVLLASDGQLQILTLDGQVVRRYDLGSEARVLASPVIQDGVIYVVQEDGTLNIIQDPDVTGYGNAIWPRYRHDNLGSAALSTGDPSPGATPTASVYLPWITRQAGSAAQMTTPTPSPTPKGRPGRLPFRRYPARSGRPR